MLPSVLYNGIYKYYANKPDIDKEKKMAFKPLSLDNVKLAPFHKFDKEWALLAAGTRENLNAMTVSWGLFGTLWHKPVATVFARPQRYTREFLEREQYYTVSFFPAAYKKALAYMGQVSGRDEDKISKAEWTPVFDNEVGAPYFEQAELVLVCRKLYTDDITPDRFIDASIPPELYPEKDFHRFYIGEVVEILQKEA